MATRLEINPGRNLIVDETIEDIEARYDAAEDGAAIRFDLVWGYGQHDPDPVWLRRAEIKGMSPTADRGDPPPSFEGP